MILANVALIAAHGQEPESTTEYLMKYKWVPEMVREDGVSDFEVYSLDTLTSSVRHDKTHEEYGGWEDYDLESLYYVSDTLDSTFRHSQVGKKNTGKYYILWYFLTVDSRTARKAVM